MRPMVIVFENPNEDPSVFKLGDVDVVELSTYPISRYADSEDIAGGALEDSCRTLLDRVTRRFSPRQRRELVTHLRAILAEIEDLKERFAVGEDDPED